MGSLGSPGSAFRKVGFLNEPPGPRTLRWGKLVFAADDGFSIGKQINTNKIDVKRIEKPRKPRKPTFWTLCASGASNTTMGKVGFCCNVGFSFGKPVNANEIVVKPVENQENQENQLFGHYEAPGPRTLCVSPWKNQHLIKKPTFRKADQGGPRDPIVLKKLFF